MQPLSLPTRPLLSSMVDMVTAISPTLSLGHTSLSKSEIDDGIGVNSLPEPPTPAPSQREQRPGAVLSPPAEATQCLGFLPRLLVGEVLLPHLFPGQRLVGVEIQGEVLKHH